MEFQIEACVNRLIAKKWRIAFAESASAGLLSYRFSTVINSGEILLGGIVSYHERIKEDVLEIPRETIQRHTAESAEVTRAMARHLKQITNADVNIALTGLTTPGGSETPEKPVGTIFIHFIFPNDELARRFEFKGSPEAILEQALDQICQVIIDKT